MINNQQIVLVVDDSPTTLLNIKQLLIDEPYDLLTASSGKKALALATKRKPDLILLDVVMPEMDGFAVCKALREMDHGANIPILMLTGLDDPESRLKGLEHGADDFINKTFDSVELKARVRTILKLDRARRINAAKDRFNWVIETARTGFVITDKNDHIIFTNPRARRMLDLEDACSGLTFLAAARKHCMLRPEALWENWPTPLAEDEPEKRLLIRPQSHFSPAQWLEVDIKCQEQDPDQQRIIRLTDISQAIQSQQNVWTFHRFVSHKLRSPMNSLYSGIEMLHDSPGGFEPDEVDEIIDLSYTSLIQLRDEIEDIEQYLEVSRDEDFNEPSLCQQFPALVKAANRAVGIPNICIRSDESLAETRLALSTKAMTLALAELLDNSMKFHPTCEPTIQIDLHWLTNDCVQLRLTNDGHTLPVALLERVWQPYYQAEGRFTGEVAGMGLGLAMVASLIWRAGGSCRMKNRPEQNGVVVELDIPTLQLNT